MDKPQTHRVVKSSCPECGYVAELATGIGHRRPPAPGDVSVCVGCLSPIQFGEDMTLKKITRQEFAKLPDEVQAKLAHAQRMITQARASRN